MNKNKLARLLGLTLVAFATMALLVACAPSSAPAPTPEVPAPEVPVTAPTPDPTPVADATTLDSIRARGVVKCGIAGDLPGFSAPGTSAYGVYVGIDAELCYALAAAVFGDASKAEFTKLTTTTRFTSVASGEVDVLVRNTTHTLSRDASVEDASGGLDFTWYNFIDGQGFLVKKSLNVTSAKELGGATICIQTGTTTELNLQSFFADNNLSFTPNNVVTNDDAAAALDGGACEVYTTDKSGLAALLTKLSTPSAWVILGDTISKEPLGPVVASPKSAADTSWSDLVLWVGYALINAEEMGVTAGNASTWAADANSPTNVKLLLGVDGDGCQWIDPNLSKDCFAAAIKAIGNYGELYERTVGGNTPLGLVRAGSPNALPQNGGALYAPPLR